MRPALFLPLILAAGIASAYAAAPPDCWALRKHGHSAGANACFEALTRSTDPWFRAEGFWGLEQWDHANEQFRLAAQSQDRKSMIDARWGRLLHERFNDTDAADLFHEALTKDPSNSQAYVGLALVSADGFDSKTGMYLAKAIEADPESAEPLELLADLALENDERDTAATEADKAIAVSADALDAMAVHAALELLADRSPDAWFARIRAVNPGYGEAYARVAHQLELHYRYEDAVN